MGTQVSVTLWTDDTAVGEQQANAAIDAVMTEMRRLDQTLSPYIATSSLAQLNQNATTNAQPITAEMEYLLARSKYYGDLTHGAFDITFASVGWRYDYRNKIQPDQKQTAELLPAINYRWLQVDETKHTVQFKHPNVRIDLGGIAKGYAVDQAIIHLKQHGIKHATVSAGGDSKILGDKRGKPWLIGIKHPRLEAGEEVKSVMTLPLENTAISTSGDYERFFLDENGERVHHIINPKTGRPTHGIMSATIIGANGIDTDALSTSVFVLGVEEGLALINTLPGFDCIIISADGKVHYSAGLVEP